MLKDFLFLSYSFVDNANFYFRGLEKIGYSCDFVYENTIRDFAPSHQYKVVVLYLHDDWSIPITNHLLDNYYKSSKLIQHDDTDHTDVQVWSNRKPDLIMQRELTADSLNSWGSTVYPFHFPMDSLFDPLLQTKDIDVSFVGRMNNQRRIPFVNHIVKLANGSLSNLKWYVDVGNSLSGPTYITKRFVEIANKSKISLNYYGNSMDSWRTWQVASAGSAIIMPKLPLLSMRDDFIKFDDYLPFKDDCSDLEEKILFMLAEERYKDYGKRALDSFNLRHNPQKCFERYYEIVYNNIIKNL